METPKRKWISVDKQLPPKYEDVWVKTIDGEIDTDHRFESGSGRVRWDFYDDDEVTHWAKIEKQQK